MYKKYIIKTCIVIAVLVIVGFVGTTFAQEVALTQAQEDMKTVAGFLNLIISIFSWLWVFFANIAGKFLMNSWVYGEGIGMDKYLWILRNATRNISNYILWFVFIFFLFKALFYQEEAAAIIKNNLIYMLIAGVGIQASRFLVAATVDLSTITTAAVGALPAQVLTTNEAFKQGLKVGGTLNRVKASYDPTKEQERQYEQNNQDWQVDKRLVIDLFMEHEDNFITHRTEPLETPITHDNFIDSILPKPDNISGPLIFLGASIIEPDKITPQDLTHPTSAIMKILIEGFGILFYGIAMLVLAIIGFVRILYLRMFIVLSPVLILIVCLEGGKGGEIPGIKDASKWLKDAGLHLSSFFLLAFKPVIITLGITFAFIFAVLMNKIISEKDQQQRPFEPIQGTMIESRQQQSRNNDRRNEFQTSIDSGHYLVIFRGINKTLGQLILTIFTIVAMWFIIKIALQSKTGIKFIDENVNKAIQRGENSLKDIPFVPIGSGQRVGINDVFGSSQDSIKRRLDQKYFSGKIENMKQESIDTMSRILGEENVRLTPSEVRILQTHAQSTSDRQAFITHTKQLSASASGEKQIWLISDEWRGAFVTWLNSNKGSRDVGNAEVAKLLQNREEHSKKAGNDQEALKTFMNVSANREYYRSIFGGTWPAPNSSAIRQKENFN